MYEFYVTIVGATQGRFRGEASAERHGGKLAGLAYEQASDQAAGKGAFGPVRFTKQWGAASPQLLQALADGEALTEVTFEFVRSNEEGEEQVFHRLRLHGARITAVRAFIDLDAEPSSLMPLPPLEEVEIAHAGMEVENLLAGTAARVGLRRATKARAASPRAAKPAAKPRARR